MAKTDRANIEDMPKNSGKGVKSESEKHSAKTASKKQASEGTRTTQGTKSSGAKSGSSPPDASSTPRTDERFDKSLESVPLTTDDEVDIPHTDDALSLEEQLAAERDKYLRLAAEYDNYRKRSAKEREMTYKDARIESVTKLLPIYDNFERALQLECADEPFYKGIEMIMAQFNEMFEGMGVKHIPAVGEPFDPKFHNAVQMIADPNLGENIIAGEYQKGFTLGDRVIRFSTVVVAN